MIDDINIFLSYCLKNNNIKLSDLYEKILLKINSIINYILVFIVGPMTLKLISKL